MKFRTRRVLAVSALSVSILAGSTAIASATTAPIEPRVVCNVGEYAQAAALTSTPNDNGWIDITIRPVNWPTDSTGVNNYRWTGAAAKAQQWRTVTATSKGGGGWLGIVDVRNGSVIHDQMTTCIFAK